MELKVGLLNDSFPPTIDGVANTMLNYASIIQKKHGESIVITPSYPNVVDNYPFDVYRFSSIDFRGRMPYRVGNPFSPITLAELRKKEMDILHVHCPFSSAVLARQLNNSYTKKKKLPIVFTYHTKFDIDLEKFVPNTKFRKVAHRFVLDNIRSADEVWVVSEGAGKNIREFGYTGDYLVMPNGTDFNKGRASKEIVDEINRMYKINNNKYTFLFVGRMIWWKNLKLILDGLKLLTEAGLEYQAIFVGNGVDRAAIEQYSHTCGINDRTIFTGPIYDREKVRGFFSIADLLLFPSTYDTSGLVVKEAAACDCASLLVKDSCASEGVEDGVTGLLIEENAESFAKKILEAARGENTFKKLGETAGEKIYFSWEQAVDMAYSRYEEIIKARRK